MARKGVNLLEGDDEEREGDSGGDSGDDGDDGGSYERRRGGFVDVLMVILFVCVMLGGVAWAGYQFWWLPKMRKTEQLEKARMKEEQQRKMRLAKLRGATERPQQAPGASGQFRQNQDQQEQKRGLGGAEQNMQPERPAAPGAAEKPISPAAPKMERKAAPRSPAEKAPLAAAPIKKPAMASREKAKPKQQMVVAAVVPEKKVPPVTPAPVRPSPRRKPDAEKKTEKPKAKIRGGTGIRKPSRGFYYSVQVASCRTGRCAEAFSKRLKGKGFSVFKVSGVSRARRSSSRMTEVRLGSFSSLPEARALANEARKKRIGARVYRYNNRWTVAAGSFRNLEDAALLLDRAEDSGFRGELASRLQRGGTRRLYRIRTGKFESLRDALAFRKKIRLAGFSDAIVVRRRSRK